jgi:diphthine-ammonia ligase
MAELSNIVKNNKLVSQEDWRIYIDSLRIEPVIEDEKEAVSLIKEKFLTAVEKRITEKFGIFFSGGVDSTSIAYACKHFKKDFVCYTVGIEGSKDIEFSKRAASKLNLDYRNNVLSLKDAEELFIRTAKILGNDLNIVNLGVGSVILSAIELAEKDNIKTFFSGLGSEEIFAGYLRHEQASDLNEECWAGLKTMWERDFKRDYALSDYKKANFLTPFLDRELISAAMSISPKLKIKDGMKKYIMRKAAISMGLSEEFALRPKSAAQYGSSFDKAIARIAKSKGFKLKSQYLDYLSHNK